MGTSILLLIGINIFYYLNKDELATAVLNSTDQYDAVPPEVFTKVFFMGQIIGGVIMIGLILLFYRIIYGILLKRLKNNYKELERMEI